MREFQFSWATILLCVVTVGISSIGIGCSPPVPSTECNSGETRACYSGAAATKGKGTCKEGQQTCNASGTWDACSGEVLPTEETCDGKDNDCDGKTDEELKGDACSKSSGVCAGLLKKCGGEKGWIACTDDDYLAHNKSYLAKEGKTDCDNIDNDCDGQTDEECECKDGTTQVCGTSDAGECKKGTQTCASGMWGTCTGEVKPGKEICDGKDNNCDGKTDEGCDCKDGTTKECGKDTGVCTKGIQTCTSGKWGACTGEVKPGKEICDGKDNNCDGKTDEGCDCLNDAKRACGSNDTGLCQKGTQACVAGKWGACTGEVKPATEICDGKDNNCDGKTDEGCQCKPTSKQSCGLAKGECQQGAQTCSSAGQWGACTGGTQPTKEVCDGKDNNCDGKVDEALTTTCKTACGSGKILCQNGKVVPCDAPKPQTEICDGKDNNCDGKTDEGCQCRNGVTRACGASDVGECKKGTQTCASGKWGTCVGEVKATTETCDGKDNNCDGKTDEGCQCRNGVTRACGKDTGECKKGIETCASGQWGSCKGEVKAKTEICDGKDNNCDGQIDNGSNLCASGQVCKGVSGCQSTGPKPLFTGTFVNASYKVSGTLSIVKDSQGEKVVFGSTFKSDAGPDLKVYLTTDPKGNAGVGSFLNLGAMQSTSGTQTYRLPAGKTSSSYKAVVIWCQRFGANFGYATLK